MPVQKNWRELGLPRELIVEKKHDVQLLHNGDGYRVKAS